MKCEVVTGRVSDEMKFAQSNGRGTRPYDLATSNSYLFNTASTESAPSIQYLSGAYVDGVSRRLCRTAAQTTSAEVKCDSPISHRPLRTTVRDARGRVIQQFRMLISIRCVS
jgi:hypothetical protein